MVATATVFSRQVRPTEPVETNPRREAPHLDLQVRHAQCQRPSRCQSLFGGRSAACDFVDLAQKAFCTYPVVPLQGSFGHLFAASTTVSRLHINPPNRLSTRAQSEPDPEGSTSRAISASDFLTISFSLIFSGSPSNSVLHFKAWESKGVPDRLAILVHRTNVLKLKSKRLRRPCLCLGRCARGR